MYVTSRKSKDKMIHEENCRYAKMMAPRNKVYFHGAQDAFAKGKIACRYCSMVIKKLSSEMKDIQNICEANGISIAFNYVDGTLEVTTPISGWKIAPVGNKDVMNLYHKNIADYDDGTSPYTGYHFQKVKSKTILRHLKYIIEHDWYEQQRRFGYTKKQKNNREVHHNREMRVSRRIRYRVRMRRMEIRYSIREAERYAVGM